MVNRSSLYASRICGVVFLATAVVALVVACGGESNGNSPGDAGDPNGDDGGPTRAPEGNGFCCKPDQKPGCCMAYGGWSVVSGACGRTCDGMPLPSSAWRLEKDEHGCDVWKEPARVQSSCCGCRPPPDAGPDPDASTDADTDGG